MAGRGLPTASCTLINRGLVGSNWQKESAGSALHPDSFLVDGFEPFVHLEILVLFSLKLGNALEGSCREYLGGGGDVLVQQSEQIERKEAGEKRSSGRVDVLHPLGMALTAAGRGMRSV